MSDEVFDFEVVEGETLQQPSSIFASDEDQLVMVDYLARELEEAASDSGRTVRMDRNQKIKRQRLAQPESETKDFPWKNASNVTTPLALQKTNLVTTKLLSAFMSKKPLFTYTTYDPDFKPNAEAITRHIQKQVESPYGIDLYRKLWSIVYNATSLGTEFVKVPFVVDQMKFNRTSETGGTETVEKILKAVPDVVPINFEDFVTRYQWNDIQRAPWVGVKHVLYSHELRRLEQQGYYQNVEGVLRELQPSDEHKVEEMRNLGVEETGIQDPHNYPYEVFECYLRWDVDGDGFDEDIIVHIEIKSKEVLRVEYNELGMRPIVRIPYVDIPDQLYGLGVGDIVSSLQDEADTLHNMRNDGTQLSMMPFVVTSESSAFGQSMELYPGKFMKAPVPREDIIIHKFPGVGGEAIQAENIVQQLADDATGASQALSGQDVGGYNRIGASGTQFLANQSTTYLDTISTQMGFAMAEIGLLILYQNVLNSEMLDLSMLSESDQERCMAVYKRGVEDIPGTFQFSAKLSSIADSRSSKQQEAMSLFQIYTAYIDKIIQLGASMANPQFAQMPQVSEAISTGYLGLTKMMKDILRKYDEDELGDYLPFVADLEKQLEMADQMREQELEQIEQGQAQTEDRMVTQAGMAPAEIGSGGSDIPQGEGAGSGEGAPVVSETGADADIEPV